MFLWLKIMFKSDEHKLYAPVAFGSKIFNATQLKLSIYAKEFLGVHFAFDTFAHILWGATKPILVLTDNKSLTSFFQAKTIPAALWNAVDHVLNFNFVLGHVPGRANTAADFLSRIHINPSTKLSLKISTKMPIHGVEVEMKPSVPDNSLTALQCYEDDDFQICDLDVEISEILCDLELNSLAERNPLDEFEFHDDNQPLNLIEEQHKDLNIRIVIDWIQQSKKPDYPYFNDELQKYRKHLHRLLVKNGILYRKFYDHTGKVLNNQFVVPKQLRKELLYRIHNSRFSGHLGIKATASEFRKRFYFPNFTEMLLDYIKNCSSCLQTKAVKNSDLKSQMLSVASQQCYPGDLLEVDLVGKLKPSQGYTHILTAMDVFSRYLFAISIRNASAETVASQLFHLFMQHSYLPTTILCDLGTVFTSKMMQELCSLLEINLKFATIKHPQTIGVIERSHATVKRIMSIHEDSLAKDWHKYVDIATFVFNTSYHSSLGCTPVISWQIHSNQLTIATTMLL